MGIFLKLFFLNVKLQFYHFFQLEIRIHLFHNNSVIFKYKTPQSCLRTPVNSILSEEAVFIMKFTDVNLHTANKPEPFFSRLSLVRSLGEN